MLNRVVAKASAGHDIGAGDHGVEFLYVI